MNTEIKRSNTIFDLYRFSDKYTFYVIDKFDMFNPTKSVTNNIEKVVSYILRGYLSKKNWMDETIVIYYKDTLGDIDQVFWNVDEEGNINCYFVPDKDSTTAKANRQKYILESIKNKKLQIMQADIVV